MKKLFAFLILFSVNSLADDYCYISGNNIFEIEAMIKRQCDEGDALLAVLNVNRHGVSSMNSVSVWFCNFDKQIIINSDESNTYLQCILEDNEVRDSKQ